VASMAARKSKEDSSGVEGGRRVREEKEVCSEGQVEGVGSEWREEERRELRQRDSEGQKRRWRWRMNGEGGREGKGRRNKIMRVSNTLQKSSNLAEQIMKYYFTYITYSEVCIYEIYCVHIMKYIHTYYELYVLRRGDCNKL